MTKNKISGLVVEHEN